ncbi:MAG: protein-L-isoaspartate(D-aspartate) O-methyltransferase [Rhodoferax sp.]|nr:protein-L-isoaspartate(D-aspartate) O-methyltransferase [Betaproteobacteria bacterium]NCN97151.1 protein-L-isoaspartate(D-aspartate) O-methyltransferase [Rhodoferax sp.]OIP17392.1 MAG: protein-L-isoaspartate O-methyltransferase [Comamonadaceae bacterium CG2_30_57_122]PIZ22415.1 MAG: protein-L-isoaspartate O-methyltransferase [Comamonadaceae bacterium CG_4_10_14_0_8_um_filter_57_29]PJC14930.1 MAG: protein-L-isoaspartate O-methyltransferase [Comamonadaceae bacterium CG_4_9_14_0_8_um_filter_57_
MTLHKLPAQKVRPGFPARLGESKLASPPVRPALAHALASDKGHPGLMPHGLGMDSIAVRQSMVRKLAQQGITDPLVLKAMGHIERHRFVDSALVNQAYEDTSLPIGLEQTISKPGVVARMLELLRQGQSGSMGRVLEIGTGCGYQAAVLSQLCTEVYSIERLRGLHDKARDNLRHFRLANLHLLLGDGMLGYAKGAPYAGIIAAAGGDAIPAAWLEQLAIGGRLVAPVSAAASSPARQALVVVDKTIHGLKQTVMEAVHFVPLKSGVA